MAERTRKTPQGKKRDQSYREFRTQMENPHAFRKNWPKKKARVNRQDRVKMRALLATHPIDELSIGTVKSARKRKSIVKNGVVTVRE
jgi:hypothetical protein